jgi:hypothetical protein
VTKAQSTALRRLETLHALCVAEDRDLTEAEVEEWAQLRKVFDAMPAPKQTPPDISQLRPATSPLVATKVRDYSVIRAIKGLALGDRAVDCGLEAELDAELRRSKEYKGIALPINSFLKTTAGQDSLSAGPGGVLATTDRLLIDLLAETETAILKSTVLGPLGVNVVTVQEQAVRIPVKTGRSTGQWINRDGSGVITDLTYDEIGPIEPASAVVAAKIQRSALVYTPLQESLVRQDLADTYIDTINSAFLTGSGAANQPIGLFKALTDGARDFTGLVHSGINKAAITAFQNDKVASYADSGPGRKWLAHPDFVLAVTCSPVWAGALQPISDGSTLCGFPIVSSFRAEHTGTPFAVFGDFGQSYMFQFGIALDLLANFLADAVFMSGGCIIRGIADCNFATRDKKRYALASDCQVAASVPA